MPRHVVLGWQEQTASPPEFSHLGVDYRQLDHGKPTTASPFPRGFGATKESPVGSSSEENLLCLTENRWEH